MQETSSVKTEITVQSTTCGDPSPTNIPEDLKNFLESLWSMSLSEDWDEASAQDLVMCGGELYEKYKNS